ncbi:MAG: ABC transporter ATP-binding protein [Deltaproteobacteria bacterium]|nr:ABC transporter ATP-binding protein [Deltaproteobacteria bacterium]
MHVERLSVTLGARSIVRDLDLDITEGHFVAIVGPSGAGKTTSLRAVAGLLPARGKIELFGAPLATYDKKRLARTLGFLRQDETLELEFTVDEVVRMGRSPHHGLLELDGEEDAKVTSEALRLARAEHLRERSYLTLSSGERQRVLLARTLAQSPRLLLLDEPTSHLDIGHQLDVLWSIKRLGLTVVAVVHDLAIAAQLADETIVLADGAKVAAGPTDETLTPELVSRVFGVRAERLQASDGQPVFCFAPLEK